MIDWFRGEIDFLHDPIPAGRVLSLVVYFLLIPMARLLGSVLSRLIAVPVMKPA